MLDTIVKSLFPIDRLDRLEEKVNQLEKDVKQILEAVEVFHKHTKTNSSKSSLEVSSILSSNVETIYEKL
jgi:archaellum component FlaC